MHSNTNSSSTLKFKNVDTYWHFLLFLYIGIYVPWFTYLEQTVTASSDFLAIQIPIDELIPFCEYFIVPYLLWFPFMGLTGLFFGLHDKQQFYQFAFMLITGMTIFLIFCTVVPNGQTLRPETFTRDNFFVDLVKILHREDTPTNVFPSLHAYNTMVACLTVYKCTYLKKYKVFSILYYTLGILIVMATCFLKQHSILDAIGALIMVGILYPLIYKKRRPIIANSN